MITVKNTVQNIIEIRHWLARNKTPFTDNFEKEPVYEYLLFD